MMCSYMVTVFTQRKWQIQAPPLLPLLLLEQSWKHQERLFKHESAFFLNVGVRHDVFKLPSTKVRIKGIFPYIRFSVVRLHTYRFEFKHGVTRGSPPWLHHKAAGIIPNAAPEAFPFGHFNRGIKLVHVSAQFFKTYPCDGASGGKVGQFCLLSM